MKNEEYTCCGRKKTARRPGLTPRDSSVMGLQSQLLGAPVSIVSVGHGEANPVASNATTAGQKQNRRVTLTLPQP